MFTEIEDLWQCLIVMFTEIEMRQSWVGCSDTMAKQLKSCQIQFLAPDPILSSGFTGHLTFRDLNSNFIPSTTMAQLENENRCFVLVTELSHKIYKTILLRIHCTLYIIHYTLYIIRYTLYIIQIATLEKSRNRNMYATQLAQWAPFSSLKEKGLLPLLTVVLWLFTQPI